MYTLYRHACVVYNSLLDVGGLLLIFCPDDVPNRQVGIGPVSLLYFFPISEFSYILIKYLLNSSIAKWKRQIFLERYGKSQRNSAIADHRCCCPVVYTVWFRVFSYYSLMTKKRHIKTPMVSLWTRLNWKLCAKSMYISPAMSYLG